MLSARTYERLCRQVVSGDERCIAELYDLYGNALYGVILRIVKSEEVASEILQDTFTKVWSRGSSFDPDMGRFSPKEPNNKAKSNRMKTLYLSRIEVELNKKPNYLI